MSSRWLKPAPGGSAPNVSQSDVRRIAREKAAQEGQENLAESAATESVSLMTSEEGQTTLGGVTPPNPTLARITPQKNAESAVVAPARDFNKRANSLDRLALPAGLFPGSSKKLYDALYIRTRGAIVPVKSIRATRREIIDWSGIRNIKTIDAHLRYLTAVGLLIHHWERGQNDGSTYEVRLPEETTGLAVSRIPPGEATPPDATLGGVTPPKVASDQNSVLPLDQNLGLGGASQTVDFSGTFANPKTSFKTNTENDDDDAALAGLNETLRRVTREVTGRDISIAENDRWRELAEVLAAELKIAAARTTVSSAPAFLAEHLRRRLWKIDKKQARAEGKELPDEARSTEPGVNASGCPDCRGSGWWYPEGAERGVAKCRHEKLQKSD